MEFVNKLRRFQRNQTSIRKTLLEYGTRDWTNFARPLNQLSAEEVTTLILNWVPKALSKNETIRIRLRADHKVYEVIFKHTRGIICVKSVKEEKHGTIVLLETK